MAITEAELSAIIGNAKKVIARDTLKEPSTVTKANNGGGWGDVPMNESYSMPSYDNYSKPIDAADYDQTNFTDEQINSSFLPKEIKESFLKERISNGGNNKSVLDGLNLPPSPPMQQRAPAAPTPAPSYNMGFDYTAMKAIIKECLSEYFASNNVLNEGALSTIKLGGNKITLVDGKGNIYSGKIERKGNINDK